MKICVKTNMEDNLSFMENERRPQSLAEWQMEDDLNILANGKFDGKWQNDKWKEKNILRLS